MKFCIYCIIVTYTFIYKYIVLCSFGYGLCSCIVCHVVGAGGDYLCTAFVSLKNLTGFWIRSFLLRCFPMYKICFWSSTTVLLEICFKGSYTISTFQQYCVTLQVRNNMIEGYTISSPPRQSVCDYWKDSSNFVLAILVNKYLSCTSQESCMTYRWKGTTNWSILLP